MDIIGSFEAKTHWSALLEKVSLGQDFIITKRGKPIARLTHELGIEHSEDLDFTIEKLLSLRKTLTLQCNGEDFKSIGRS